MPAQLPAGQHRLNRWCIPSVDFSFCALFEKAEGQQNTRSCLRWCLGCSIVQTGEGQIAEALGQLEAARPCQLKVLAPTRRRKTKARGVVPQETEVTPGSQCWQRLKRINAIEGHGQTQQAVIATAPSPRFLSRVEEIAETEVCRHPLGCEPMGLLKCIGADPRCRGLFHV